MNQNAGALTITGTGNTITVAGAATQAVTVQGTSNYVVSGNTTGAVNSTTTGTLSVTASANAQTVTSTSATTINAAALAGVTETLAGNGNYTVTGLGTGAAGVILESGARTGTLTVTTAGTNGGTVTESAGTGAVVINHVGTGTLAVATDAAHGVTTITASAANTVTASGTGTISYTATGAGNHVITSTTSGAAADVIVASTNAASVDTITAGAGADKITISGGNDHLVLFAPTTDTGIVSGFTATAAVPANLQQLNVAGLDVVTGFSAGADLQLTGLTTSTTIIRNGGTLGAATVGDTVLLTGDYNASTGIFTVNTAGTSSLFVYDDTGTGAAGNYRGVVLVGYTDQGGADTVSAGGLFAGVA